MLSTKYEYAANSKQEMKYWLTVNQVNWIHGEECRNVQKAFAIEYSQPNAKKETLKKVLIIKPDNAQTCVAIVVNSLHKYYCQILLMSLQTAIGIQ